MALLAAVAGLFFTNEAFAAPIIFATSDGGNKLVKVDVATNVITTIVNTTSPDSHIISQSPNEIALDGLTYDSFTGRLYAASSFTGNIFSFDPNNLSNVVTIPVALPGADGIEGDGLGNLYLAGTDQHIYQYNL